MKLSTQKINIAMLKSVHTKSGIYQHTATRCTIMLEDDLVKKLHDIQAKLIKESQKSVSFSSVLNDTLRKSLEP
jgi:hypothetical protein